MNILKSMVFFYLCILLAVHPGPFEALASEDLPLEATTTAQPSRDDQTESPDGGSPATLPGKNEASSDDSKRIPNISVTATRGKELKLHLPANVTNIGSREIQMQNPTVLTETLQGVPGLHITDTSGTGYSSSVDMRGFGESGNIHTLVLIDGQRMNNADLSGTSWSSIPVTNVANIEVTHGPGTVLYGDNAVGGTINVITKEGNGPLSGSVQGKYGSYNLWGGQGSLQGGGLDLTGYVSGRYNQTDGYREHSRAKFANFDVDGRYYPTDTIMLKLDGGYSSSDSLLPGYLTEEQVRENPRQAGAGQGETDDKKGYLFLRTRKDWGPLGMAIVDLAGISKKTDSVYYTRGVSTTNTGRIQPKYVLDRMLGERRYKITAGVDLFYDDLKSDTYNTDGSYLYNNTFQFMRTAPYLIGDFHLTPPLVLTAGGRYQFASYTFKQETPGEPQKTEDQDQNEPAWTVGLTWNFLPGSKLFGSIYRLFNYPVADQFITYGVFSPLKPETGMNYQIGMSWGFLPGGTLSVTGYWLDLANQIYYNPETMMNENLAQTRHLGMESAFSIPFWSDRMRLNTSLTYQNVQFSKGPYTGNTVPLVPEWLASVGVQAHPFDGFQIGLQALYTGSQVYGNDYTNVGDRMDPYCVLNMNMGYTWKKFKIIFNADNLTNQEYSTYTFLTQDMSGNYYAGYYPEPGFNARVSMTVNF